MPSVSWKHFTLGKPAGELVQFHNWFEETEAFTGDRSLLPWDYGTAELDVLWEEFQLYLEQQSSNLIRRFFSWVRSKF